MPYLTYDKDIQKNIKTNMKKFTNSFIVSVDGVDGAGKSTFIKNLKNELEKILDTDKVDITIQHFPNYDIDSGKDIKHMLLTCTDPFDPAFIEAMTNVNMFNRYQTICDYEPDENKEFHIILLDRYKSSNDFFNIMKYKYLANAVVDNTRDVYRDIIVAHLNELDYYYTPEPDLQIFATIDEELQLERLSKKLNKDKFENTDNIRFVNNLFSKYIDMRLPLKYKGDRYYPLFSEKYSINQIDIDNKDYSLETDMESKLSERCAINDNHETLNYYDPESQEIKFYDFKYDFNETKYGFPIICKELNKFLYGNILILPMELFDKGYIKSNFYMTIKKYPVLKACEKRCLPGLMTKGFPLRKCKIDCIPKTIMNRVLDIILINMDIPKQ